MKTRRRSPSPPSSPSAPSSPSSLSAPSAPPIRLRGLVWMTVGGANLGGPGRISLLRAIRDTGTITHAARAMRMSYKAAWDAVDLMNSLAGEPLVLRSPGGRGGGSTRLTARGEQLIERFDEVERLHGRFVEALDAASRGLRNVIEPAIEPSRPPDERVGPQNRLPGEVVSVRCAGLSDEVALRLPNGDSICAMIAAGNSDRFGLRAGSAAVALFDAASVILATGRAVDGLSACNHLAGVVGRVQRRALDSEVVLALPGSGSVTAIVSGDSVGRLGLAAGTAATAVFKASDVSLELS